MPPYSKLISFIVWISLAFVDSSIGKSGILYAEVTTARDGDAYVYNIECAAGVDMRKNLFFAMAEQGWPIVGLESVGTSLEDVFISLIDKKVSSKRKGE